MEQKFFLYVRKSTDVEDKQALSIEAQLAELRIYAKKEGLSITEEFVEKQSAKVPGRPIFNAMLERLEQGEASGIISWHPDRLARNSVDGGRIIYLLDCGRLHDLKFPQFWFENTPQGKFMLNISFGQSKYYVDSLSENVKRGLRQKVRRGEYPGMAPLGYLNDPRSGKVVVDRKRMGIVREAFELYAQGRSRLEDISLFFKEKGIVSKHATLLKRGRISYILSNPFYVGLFRYAKETHEGKHEAIVSKKLFDEVQVMLKQKGKPQRKAKNVPQALCGLLSCGTCGRGITAEHRIKRQKNGNTHEYIYYHCTKKNKFITCNEPCIREKDLKDQVSSLLEPYALPKDWTKPLLEMLEKDECMNTKPSAEYAEETRRTVEGIKTKLQRLLDSYLEQDIEREVYLQKKAELMSDKKSLEEKIVRFETEGHHWIEPMRAWLKEAENMDKIVCEDDLTEKKVMAKKIFGSNLLLSSKNVVVGSPKNVVGGLRSDQKNVVVRAQNVVENVVVGIETQWAALYAARQMIHEESLCIVLVAPRGIEPLLTA